MMIDWGTLQQWLIGTSCLAVAFIGRAPLQRQLSHWATTDAKRYAARADKEGFGNEYREAITGMDVMPGDTSRVFHRLRTAFSTRRN